MTKRTRTCVYCAIRQLESEFRRRAALLDEKFAKLEAKIKGALGEPEYAPDAHQEQLYESKIAKQLGYSCTCLAGYCWLHHQGRDD